MSIHPSEARFDVLWPSSLSTAEHTGLAPRLATLEGKRVAFVWDHLFRGDEMFDAFHRAVAATTDTFTTVPHAVFGNIHGPAEEEERAVAELGGKLREAKADAAVVAVGA